MEEGTFEIGAEDDDDIEVNNAVEAIAFINRRSDCSDVAPAQPVQSTTLGISSTAGAAGSGARPPALGDMGREQWHGSGHGGASGGGVVAIAIVLIPSLSDK